MSKDAAFCLKDTFNGAITTSACVKDLNIKSNIPPKTEFHLSECSSTTKQDRIFRYAFRSEWNLLPVLNYELSKTKFSKHAAFSQRNLRNFSAFRSSKSIFLFHGWVINSDTSHHRVGLTFVVIKVWKISQTQMWLCLCLFDGLFLWKSSASIVTLDRESLWSPV